MRSPDKVRNLDLNNLRIFAVVVETGSMTAAAKILGVCRSRVCRRMTDLEWQLDAKLIRVDTRSPLAITELGIEVYKQCVKAIDAINEVGNLVRAQRGDKPAGFFVSSPADIETLPVNAHQVRTILREELGAFIRGNHGQT